MRYPRLYRLWKTELFVGRRQTRGSEPYGQGHCDPENSQANLCLGDVRRIVLKYACERDAAGYFNISGGNTGVR